MGKAQFLEGLRRALEGRLPPEELADVLSYYEEYFADAGEDREEAVAEELGSPEAVAAQLLEDRGETPPAAPPAARRRLPEWLIALLCILGVLVLVVVLLMIFNISAYQKTSPPGETVPASLVPSVESPAPSAPGGAAPAPAPSQGISASAGTVEITEVGDFSGIEVNLPMGSVTVTEGETAGLALTWYAETGSLRWGVDRGTLKVWTLGVHSTGDDSQKGGEVVITVPAGMPLHKIEVEVAMGSAEVSGLEAEEVDVEVTMGTALLRGVAAREADLSAVMGTATVKDCVVTHSLDVECAMGEAEVDGDFPCEVDIEVASGAVRFSTGQAQEVYAYELESKDGSVTLDGEDMGGRVRGGSGRNELSISCDTGDIRVEFGA